MVMEEPRRVYRWRCTWPHVKVTILGVGIEGQAMSCHPGRQVLHSWLKLVKQVDHLVSENERAKLDPLAHRCEGAEAQATRQPRVLRAGLPEAQGIVVNCGPLRVEPRLAPPFLPLQPCPRRLNPLEHLNCALQLQAVLHECILELRVHHWHSTDGSPLHVHQLAPVRGMQVVAIDAYALLQATREQRVHPHAPLLIEPLDGDRNEEEEGPEEDGCEAGLHILDKHVAAHQPLTVPHFPNLSCTVELVKDVGGGWPHLYHRRVLVLRTQQLWCRKSGVAGLNHWRAPVLRTLLAWQRARVVVASLDH
mmetsp:Transcript_49780/g.115547  ORF Transcript_49780/g.115547 Transcript_49780/m.115547 type:complete len:307 (-) Transcript_49780:369-1289(-)